MVYTWGNESSIRTAGTCWRLWCLQWWFVLFFCAPPIVFPAWRPWCALLPVEYRGPNGTELSAIQYKHTSLYSHIHTHTNTHKHTPMQLHTHWVQWVVFLTCLPPLSRSHSLSYAHTQYALYKSFSNWPKSVEITGINYTLLHTHLILLLESKTSRADWERPRPTTDPQLTHLCLQYWLFPGKVAMATLHFRHSVRFSSTIYVQGHWQIDKHIGHCGIESLTFWLWDCLWKLGHLTLFSQQSLRVYFYN